MFTFARQLWRGIVIRSALLLRRLKKPASRSFILNTPLTIRQSVIANLLQAGKDVRAVQVFEGHNSPMTTERYKQTGIEELTAAVVKYHPLG